MSQAEIIRFIAKRTVLWMVGTLLAVGLLELALSGIAKYRTEVPIVLATAMGILNLFGNVFAVFLARLFSK